MSFVAEVFEDSENTRDDIPLTKRHRKKKSAPEETTIDS
jgi:hypothetical protein